MIRKAILSLGMLALASAGYAQSVKPCGTDEVYEAMKAYYPGIAEQEARLKADLDRQMKGILPNRFAKTTADEPFNWIDDTTTMHIPVVVHVISDNGPGGVSITDDIIYDIISRLNSYYSATNPGIPNGIIVPFRPYIGNARIQLHLATKDPNGKPTRGITRHYSAHASGGDELAKFGGWAPNQFLNIWMENYIGSSTPGAGTTLAYAYKPAAYEANPYKQGLLMATHSLALNAYSTLAHEVGHHFNLDHPWHGNGDPVPERGNCGDDEVDDTPPTKGHFSCGTTRLYDTVCAKGYMKSYDSLTAYMMFKDYGQMLKDYPDTTNTQNIMDYSACTTEMFTKGQVGRMRAALRSDVGFRSSLITNWNLYVTGIWDTVNNVAIAAPDIAPTAYFTVNRNFVCADGNTSVQFTNRSYNDTVTVDWKFDKGASQSTSTANSLNNTFTQEGWVKVELNANSNAGSNTLTRSDVVYAADPNPTNTSGYIQEWNPGTENDRYPIFNYFNTDHKWEIVGNAGLYDRTSIRYNNFDTRIPNIDNATLSPWGDYSDFYTPAFDLSGFGSVCNLSFYTAGAFRTNKPSEMNDKLVVYCSFDCGSSWVAVDSVMRGNLGNNGYVYDKFTPDDIKDWKEQSLNVMPRGNQTYFRFRYYPGVVDPLNAISNNLPYWTFGTGNDFYLDRIKITTQTLGVKNGVIADLGMSVVPNPTGGAATIRLNGGDDSKADVTVSDVTGKVVYSTSVRRTTATAQIEIPVSALSVKGLYLVKVVTDGATETQKLVAY